MACFVFKNGRWLLNRVLGAVKWHVLVKTIWINSFVFNFFFTLLVRMYTLIDSIYEVKSGRGAHAQAFPSHPLSTVVSSGGFAGRNCSVRGVMALLALFLPLTSWVLDALIVCMDLIQRETMWVSHLRSPDMRPSGKSMSCCVQYSVWFAVNTAAC